MSFIRFDGARLSAALAIAFLAACGPSAQPELPPTSTPAHPIDSTPVTMTNGALTITTLPASSCASLMPSKAEDASAPPDGAWLALYTDGKSDLAATYQSENLFAAPVTFRIYPAGGGAPVEQSADSEPVAADDGFFWPDSYHGACMVCQTALESWPAKGALFVGDGYPWHGSCSWAPRPGGGVDAICQKADFMGGGAVPPSLQLFDDGLTLMNRMENIGGAPVIDAVDRLSRIVVTDGGRQRWLNDQSLPLSDFFDADPSGAVALIGGGFLTKTGALIPSGSSQLTAAPEWMKSRNHLGQAQVVLGSRAYAFPEANCSTQIYDPAGNLCGSMTVAGCAAPVRIGPDGTAIAAMTGGGWKLWYGLLH